MRCVKLEQNPYNFGTDTIIYPAESHLIAAIASNPDIHIRALAERLHITSASVSKMIANCKKGLVQKQTDKDNLSRLKLSLTAKGQLSILKPAGCACAVFGGLKTRGSCKEKSKNAQCITKFGAVHDQVHWRQAGRSVSVMSDAFNNLTDAVTTMFALLSASSVIVIGWELPRNAVAAIRDPQDTVFGVFTVVVLALSVALKIFRYRYNKQKSKGKILPR